MTAAQHTERLEVINPRFASPRTIPASVIIMTKNEEHAIPRALASVAMFDQVFVVDSASTDATCTLAGAAGAGVVQFHWNGQYPKKKEWALLNLPFRNDWVLYLDADETVSPKLAAEISYVLARDEPSVAAYDIDLDYAFLGKPLKHGHRVAKRALIRRSRTEWPHVDDLDVASMWEVEGHYQPIVSGEVRRLRGRIGHDDPGPLFDYFGRHNRYSDWEAHLLRKQDRAGDVRALRSERGQRYAKVPFKPLAFFLYSFVARQGFRDGRAGFHYAVAHAFYFWQIDVKRRECGVPRPRGR